MNIFSVTEFTLSQDCELRESIFSFLTRCSLIPRVFGEILKSVLSIVLGFFAQIQNPCI